jgi:hypothetical protein
MSAPKRARDDEPVGASAAGGAGGSPPPPLPPPPARHLPPAEDDDAYERRLKLTDVIGLVALNGYAREADACAGLCRETWRCIPAGLSAADADRVRRDHPLWQAIINLEQSEDKETRLQRGRSPRATSLLRYALFPSSASLMRRCCPGALKATRLHSAVFKGSLACVRELCEWHANIEAADWFGRTPLYLACEYRRVDIVRELLARGANTEAVTHDGATSLVTAGQQGLVDLVRELLLRGANIEAATNSGCTSLHVASLRGKLAVVRELLARGAHPNTADIYGETPLIDSSRHGDVEVVRALLTAGADKHHVANNGSTAASLAGTGLHAAPASRAAILALLAAAP